MNKSNKQGLWPFRGIMLDAARQTERYAYYERLIPDLARWGYNTIILHLADDEGCAIKLDSPRLLATSGALPVHQWRTLVKLAAQHGISIIPEIECLGHTGYITRLPEYAHLREPPGQKGLYWSICPIHPQTLEFMEAIFRAIADIFPAPYIHIGMDEADIGGSALLKEALRSKPLWRIFGDYLVRINAIVQKLGRRSMAWGDHLLMHKELRDMAPRDMVICNWLYGKGHREDYEKTTLYFLDAGFDVLGCPSGCWGGTQFIPRRENLANLLEFSNTCRSLNHKNILGMLNTMWCPYRHLPAVVHPIMAYAGKLFSGDTGAFDDFITGFVARQFGLDGPALRSAAGGIAGLHTARSQSFFDKVLLSEKPETLGERQMDIQYVLEACASAETALLRAKSDVQSLADEFEQWIFTAAFLRKLAQLRLSEMENALPNAELRKGLYRSFQAACLKCRDYAGTQAEEPQMGQAGRYWQDTDNPVELLAKLAKC
ncbi:MAG: family 20 glycosylhydrolase [Kiritimatiellaeota bacterium]|nr:family 20 glycosylhydrolase [Kiritimatiellota bacterium]